MNIQDASLSRRALQVLFQLLRKPIPAAVFHYTSASGLIGIVNSGSIWATDIRYLNDSEEYAYASARIRGRLEELARDERGAELFPCLTELQRAVAAAHQRRIFAASLSAEDDLLSQWRAYCPSTGGFSVGFDPSELAQASHCMLLPCIYDEDEQDVIIEEMLNLILDEFAVNQPNPSDRKAVSAYGLAFIVPFLTLCGVMKHKGFREESEWRLVRNDISLPHGSVKFREGRSGVVPYLELPLSDENAELSFSSIIVGPNPHPELAVDAIESFLVSKEVECGKGVFRSSVPFRPW